MSIIALILQMRKLGQREIKDFPQEQPTIKAGI